jgi:ABC-type oligopeptide transport system substrate-binding subunit
MKHIRMRKMVGAVLVAATLALAGCSHKLVAHGGDTTVAVYPDKASFEKLKSLQSKGGPAGMIGGLGESLMTKKVDSGTPIKIIESDEEGYRIEVMDGPNKGMGGYVAKDSVD